MPLFQGVDGRGLHGVQKLNHGLFRRLGRLDIATRLRSSAPAGTQDLLEIAGVNRSPGGPFDERRRLDLFEQAIRRDHACDRHPAQRGQGRMIEGVAGVRVDDEVDLRAGRSSPHAADQIFAELDRRHVVVVTHLDQHRRTGCREFQWTQPAPWIVGDVGGKWRSAIGFADAVDGAIERGDSALGKPEHRDAIPIDARVVRQGHARREGIRQHAGFRDEGLIVDRARHTARTETVDGQNGVTFIQQQLGIVPILTARARRTVQHDHGGPGRRRGGHLEVTPDLARFAGLAAHDLIDKTEVGAFEVHPFARWRRRGTCRQYQNGRKKRPDRSHDVSAAPWWAKWSAMKLCTNQ